MTHDAGYSPLEMLVALWIGSLVLWGAVALDNACLFQRQAWHNLRQAEQRAQQAVNMVANTMQRQPVQVRAHAHSQVRCRPTHCRGQDTVLNVVDGADGSLILYGKQATGYFLRRHATGTDLWMQVAGKGPAVAVVHGITHLHWQPGSTAGIGTVQVTAVSDQDASVTVTQRRTVVLGGQHARA